jgi:ubiquinone/menaquinone biosynthesis C-methylase UbiE
MGINFHDPKNSRTYTDREAGSEWKRYMRKILAGRSVTNAVDVGCGGGIYSKALAELGAHTVTGIDSSEASLSGARADRGDDERLRFVYGEAQNTGLEDGQADLVVIRAVIHHLPELARAFAEASRILRAGGIVAVQDRTPEDCLIPGSETHIRGWIFTCFPCLAEVEKKRRWHSEKVTGHLKAAGFTSVTSAHLWETRREYDGKEALLDDLAKRKGRSLLHELNNRELRELITYMDGRLEEGRPIIEKDRWTMWTGVKKEAE